MDISRPDLARKKKFRQTLYAVTAAIVVVVITAGVSRPALASRKKAETGLEQGLRV